MGAPQAARVPTSEVKFLATWLGLALRVPTSRELCHASAHQTGCTPWGSCDNTLLKRVLVTLSLLYPLDRYRTPVCDRECDWEAYLALSRIHTGRSSQLHCSKPPRNCKRAIVVLQCLKPLQNKRETKAR